MVGLSPLASTPLCALLGVSAEIVAETGSYVVSGQQIFFRHHMRADAGSYTLSGQDTNLEFQVNYAAGFYIILDAVQPDLTYALDGVRQDEIRLLAVRDTSPPLDGIQQTETRIVR